MSEDRPFVSVIIPVYNNPYGIRQCLDALTKQTYPADRYEILVVDNNSTDTTPTVVQEFDVTLLFERKIQSSYAARNRGIAEAEGDIVAFTDADCVPEEGWMENGVKKMTKLGVDLVGGNIKFEYSDPSSAAEQFDARANMRNDQEVSKGYAKTANLFAKRKLFDSDIVGIFPETFRSGGDVFWTRKATEQGFKIAFSESAVVRHPTRNLREQVAKQYRVGKGHIDLWQEEDKFVPLVLLLGLLNYPKKIYGFLRENRDQTANEITEDSTIKQKKKISEFTQEVKIASVAMVSVMSMNLGRIIGMGRRFYSN